MRRGGILLAALAVLAAMLSTAPGLAQQRGTLDTSFSGDGVAVTNLGGDDPGRAVAIQSDGKIVVAGASGFEMAVTRYNADGTLDPTFDGDGIATAGFGVGDGAIANAVAIQDDGRILVAGSAGSGIWDVAAARFNPDGSLDDSFGYGGMIDTDLGGEDFGEDLVLLAGGGFLVAGYSDAAGTYDFALARFGDDGFLDNRFGTDGVVLTDFDAHQDYGRAVALTETGEVVIAGYSLDPPFGTTTVAISVHELDGTPGPQWRAAFADPSIIAAQGWDVATRPHGKILVSGRAGDEFGSDDFLLAQFNPDGSWDDEFGAGGVVVVDVGGTWESAEAVGIGPAEHIYAGGHSNGGADRDFALARFLPNGTPDVCFGDAFVPYARTDIGAADIGAALAVQTDGKIVLAGETGDSTGDFAVARYHGPHAAPANDAFVASIEVAGSFFNGGSAGATIEPGEPQHAGPIGGSSVWWHWTAPADGRAEIVLQGSDFDTLLGVYTGTSVDALTEIASNDNWRQFPYSGVVFGAEAGTTYRIAVDGKGCVSGTVVGTIDFLPQPPNDDFAESETIGPGPFGGSNLGATSEPGEPDHAGVACGASVWYRYTPPSDGLLTIDLAGSNFDTVLGLYTGSAVDALTEVASNNDAPGGFQTSLLTDVAVAGGVPHHIAVDTRFGMCLPDTIAGNLTFTGPPPNDAFANAIDEDQTHDIPGTNRAATSEPGEPAHHGVPGGASVWYRFSPGANGRASFDIKTADFDTVIALYTGSDVGNLTWVASNDDREVGDPRSTIDDVPVRGGTSYSLAIDGFLGEMGNYVGRFGMLDAPSNDDFANARSLGGPLGKSDLRYGTNQYATKESGEWNHAGRNGGASVWWKWKAAADGTITVDLAGSDFDTVLGVYEGSEVDSLTYVASNDDAEPGVSTSRVHGVEVTGGTTYYIAVDGFGDAMGTIRLDLDVWTEIDLVAIEVNQAIQDWENSIELIEHKATVVRAFLRPSSGSGIPTVTGRLHGESQGFPLPDGPLDPINPGGTASFGSSTQQARPEFDESLNFVLPSSWLWGDITLTLELPDDALNCTEITPPANTCSAEVSFVEGGELRLKMMDLTWELPNPGGDPISFSPTRSDLAEQALRIRQLLPVAAIDTSYGVYGTAFADEPDLPSVNLLLALLRMFDGCQGSCDRIYYAPLKGYGGGESGGIPATVAAGFLNFADHATATGAGRNLAPHEVVHALGREHAVHQSNGTTDKGLKKGWCGEVANPTAPDHPTTRTYGTTVRPSLGLMTGGVEDQVWGLDTRRLSTDLTVVDPYDVWALMSYCSPQDASSQGKWISSFNYLALHYGALAPTATPTTPTGTERNLEPTDYLIVSGLIDMETGAVSLEPARTLSAHQPPALPVAGEYAVELRDSAGGPLARADFTPIVLVSDQIPGTEPGPEQAMFIVPFVHPGADLAEIVIEHLGVTIDAIVGSPTAPTVTITGIAADSDTITVDWSGSDADGDALTYTVRYTPDDGATWHTMALGHATETITMERTGLPGSTAGRVEVTVSDGMHTGSDLSDPFPLSDTAPVVTIASPLDGTQYSPGQAIAVEGTASDAEDRTLDPSALSWTSDRDGSLGSGGTLLLPPGALTPGNHVVTASANDAAGNTGADAITIEVIAEVPLIFCRGRAANIVGTEADDDLVGTAGDDVIVAWDGNDDIEGKGGNDIICGGRGDDSIDGGSGSDMVFGEEGADRLRGGPHDDSLYGGPGVDFLDGGPGDDATYGGDGDDTLRGGAGDDVAHGESGSDRVKGGADDDELHGQDGPDLLNGGPGHDRMFGDEDADRIYAFGGDDEGYGGAGNDRLLGGAGSDMLYGGTGNDTIRGHADDDFLDGGSGTDNINGSDGFDTCLQGEKIRSCESITANPADANAPWATRLYL